MQITDNKIFVRTDEMKMYIVLEAIQRNCKSFSKCSEKCNFYCKDDSSCNISFTIGAPEEWEIVLVQPLK